MTNNEDVIRQIEATMQGQDLVPASVVRLWMSNSSLQTVGAVAQRVVRQSRRIQPPLSMDEICTFIQNYYERCLVENPQDGGYALNRHIAGLELAAWFTNLWRDPAVPRSYLMSLKAMLSRLIKEGKVPAHDLVSAVLEHIFETKEIAEFFDDWKDDPDLRGAFTLSMEWGTDHWQTPG